MIIQYAAVVPTVRLGTLAAWQARMPAGGKANCSNSFEMCRAETTGKTASGVNFPGGTRVLRVDLLETRDIHGRKMLLM